MGYEKKEEGDINGKLGKKGRTGFAVILLWGGGKNRLVVILVGFESRDLGMGSFRGWKWISVYFMLTRFSVN